MDFSMSKLFLILLGVCVFLGFTTYYYRNELSEEKKKTCMYKANNELLLDKIKKEHEINERLSDENKSLEKKIAEDKSGFDWHYNVESTPPVVELKRLHKNRNKVR